VRKRLDLASMGLLAIGWPLLIFADRHNADPSLVCKAIFLLCTWIIGFSFFFLLEGAYWYLCGLGPALSLLCFPFLWVKLRE